MSFIKSSTSELFIPESSNYRKAKPPKLGPAYGNFGGDPNVKMMRMPGGDMIGFDYTKLGLADYRAMRNHYQINISLSILNFTMHQLDWWIECEDKRISTLVEENLRDTWTRLIRGIAPAYWAGYSSMVVEYEQDRRGRIVVSKFKDLLPEDCRVNWKQVDGYAPPGKVKPKRYLYDGINELGGEVIPPMNTLWYPVLMEGGNMYGRKLLQPAFAPWFFSQLMHLFSNRYFERFGEPLPIARAPFDDDVDMGNGQMGTGRDLMLGVVQDIRNRSAVVLPAERTRGGTGDKNDFEYTIDYLESQMRGADFERYMARLDEEMSLAMFLPVLLFRTADVGSYNLGQAHEKMFFYMMNVLAGDFAEYLNRYVIDRLVDFNFGPNAKRARFQHRKLGKDTDETLRAIIQGGIQQELFTPDVEELGLALGMKMHEIVQVQEDSGAELRPDPDLEQSDPDFEQPDPDEPGSQAAVKIVNRVRDQAISLYNSGQPLTDLKPSFGHSKQMAREFMLAGVPQDEAHARVESMYGRVGAWMESVLPYTKDPSDLARSMAEVLEIELATATD